MSDCSSLDAPACEHAVLKHTLVRLLDRGFTRRAMVVATCADCGEEIGSMPVGRGAGAFVDKKAQ